MNEEPRVVGLLISHLDERMYVLYEDGVLLDAQETHTHSDIDDFHPLIAQLLTDNQH